MTTNPLISVIIPTTCESTRADFLSRSISSVDMQKGVQVELLLVCNGPKQDEDLIRSIEKEHQIKVVRLEEGNVSKARYEGLLSSKGEYFCFLDDDDEFLPDALSRRLEILQSKSDCDVVVTNGMLHSADGDTPLVPPSFTSKINSDPCLTFLEQNWFASPASLFRSSRIEKNVFNFQFKYFEWTYLFFMLTSLKRSFYYDGSYTYRKYEDHPMSVSKSIDYYLAYPNFLKTLRRLDLPKTVHTAIHNKYISALNSQSNIYRKSNNLQEAWKAHLLCLINGGFRYIPYTRHLIFPSTQ
jgi:glycosyltransferase involved in cell wall biosynthesis